MIWLLHTYIKHTQLWNISKHFIQVEIENLLQAYKFCIANILYPSCIESWIVNSSQSRCVLLMARKRSSRIGLILSLLSTLFLSSIDNSKNEENLFCQLWKSTYPFSRWSFPTYSSANYISCIHTVLILTSFF